MKKQIIVLFLFISIFLPSTLFAEVKVLSAVPSGTIQGKDAANNIVVTFNQPMVPLEKLPEGDGTGPLKISPSIKGKYRWQGNSVLMFSPKEPLPPAIEFKVTVKAGLKSQISGEKLKKDYTWKFETLRPELLQSVPREGRDWHELEDPIFLSFNQNMEPKKAKSFIKIEELAPYGKTSKIDFEIRYRIEKDSVTLNRLQYENYEAYNISRTTALQVLVLLPKNKLSKDCTYTIILEEGLLAKEGNLGLHKKRTFNFKTYKTFKFKRAANWNALEPTRPLEFHFTNPVKFSELLDAIEIEPKVEFPEYYRNYHHFPWCDSNQQSCVASFNVSLKPSTTYQIRISGKLRDKYGQVLGEDIQTYFKTSDYAPAIHMPTGFGILERYLKSLRHPIKILNVEKLRLQKALIDVEDIVPLASKRYIFSSYTRDDPPKGFGVDRIWEPKTQKNITELIPIDLQEILREKPYGIVYLQVSGFQQPLQGITTQYHKALIQVTSMGITSKFSPDGNLIYVSYLKTAAPVADCEIQLRDNNNKVLWMGRTDSNGFVRTPGWEELNIIPKNKWEKVKLWIIAKKGEDVAFSSTDWGTGIYPYYFNINYEYYPEYPKYGGHIFTERGIYRPGETVYIKGLFRERKQGEWQLPRIRQYDLIIKDSRQSEVVKTTITLSSDFGDFDYELPLKKGAPTGFYTVLLTEKGSTKTDEQDEEWQYYGRGDRKIRFSSTFRVEEYKLATFEVNVNLDQPEYISGDTATVKMQGWYLFGAPMAESELEYTVRFERGSFRPEGHPGFIYGPSWWDSDYRYSYSPGVITSAKTKLDKEGNFSFSLPLFAKGSLGTLNAIAEGSVTAPDRQKLSGRKSVTVHGGEFYIGLKPNTSFVEKGKGFEIEIMSVLPNGEMLEGQEIKCELIRREWNSVRKTGLGGRLEWITEQRDHVMSTFTILSSKSAYSWKIIPDKSGLYFFRASSSDKRGNPIKTSTYFYVTGQDYIGWSRSDDDRIELVPDKEKYKPGETAKILIKSPYERAQAVITLEREGILSQWRTEIVGSADTIDIPLTNSHLPNVYVCVMLYQGRIGMNTFSNEGVDLGKPSFKIGYTNLLVDPGNKHLKISVISDKKDYKPGDEVKAKIKVLDAKGNPTKSAVTIAVVDLGILNLINYQTPNSFPHFYGPKSLSVETSETRIHILGQRNYGEKGENRGGGGGIAVSGIDLRSRFVPTVYWNPKVITKEDGTAEVNFKLADNLTAFRIMATGQTQDSLFGAGESRFTVSKLLLLKPSLPRFAILGDKFSGGVVCHNNTKKDGVVFIHVKSKGITLLGPATQQIQIEKGGAKEIRFEFRADQVGEAEFEFRAKMVNETDGLKWTFPVKLPRPTEAVATYASTTQESKEGIKIPSDIYDETSFIDISLSPTALIGLKGGLEYLFEYPYGCLEQKTSKILPLILAGDFIDIFNLAPLKKHTAKELITGYLSEIPQFQDPSGGLGFWRGGAHSAYLTAYVLWALAEAQKKGYAVDEKVKQSAIEYLRAWLRGNKKGWDWPYSLNAELCTKAFILYSLSINGISEQGYINELFKRLDQIPLFGKIYLLKAARHERVNRVIVDEIKRDLFNRAKFSPTEMHFEESDDRGMEWIWHSNVRTTAVILQGLLEAGGEFPNAEKVVRWLARKRKSGRWQSTQENIYVFYAFNEYVRHYEKENPNFTAQVLLDQKNIIEESFYGRSLTAQNYKLDVQPYRRDVLLPVNFRKKGDGRLYYEFRMVYAPKGDLLPLDEGIKVQKTIKKLKTGKSHSNRFEKGARFIVTLKVATNQERRFVAVDDPLPAGFEVVNLSFATESREESKQFSEQRARDSSYRWWGTFNHWENYDDRVLVFADYLTRGEHTYSYLIQATTPGEFIMPATKAEEMYTPEIFGRTEQKRIQVLDE